MPVHPGASAQSGQTLLEVTVGFAVLVLGLMAFVKVMTMSSTVSRASHDESIAVEAARTMIQTLQTEEFGQVFARYNGFAGDDPPGAPGSGFAVAGLTPLVTDPDGLVGSVLFPTQAGSPGVLREDLPEPRFGTPRDLNGDGPTDDQDHAGDHLVLPVLVRIDWHSAAGFSRVELKTLLVDMP
jgi:type II secretory pathway pseudopilin PulG